MAFLKIFKDKKGSKPEKIEKAPQKIKEPSIKPVVEKGKVTGEVLESPRITEKTTFLSQANEYVFQVKKEANKTEIKKAVQSIYGVNVVRVNIINIPSKTRRVGRYAGERKSFKKAIVKIAEGQKIEIISR